nr:holo-ACP synthase [Tanacetum cinerariifolium]
MGNLMLDIDLIAGSPFNNFTLRFWSANQNHEDSDVEIVPFENQSLLTTNYKFGQVDLAGSYYVAICRETNGGEYLCLENSMLFTTGGNMSGLARSNPLEPLHQQLFWTLFIYNAFALFQDMEEMTTPSWEKRIAYVLCNHENMVISSKL